ncbi:hypothetical protein E3W66_08845 [Gammaproteobacteria bacterium LSUCC0057]|uniref:Macro domain-containing protein n=1 Tax=Gammaproteobacteria bacterium LSUCC0057 TaxID=2559237 RepID=A0A4Y8UIB3_9GAMM|nr:hypothetical protein E3W66_08845 [Gammaproteobacteria bacterium LSUCC0057]
MKIVQKNIINSGADVIVISANKALLAGSGVSGAVHKAAGPALEAYVKPLAPVLPGDAIISPAFNLPAKYVVHAVCPHFYDGLRGEPQQLAAAFNRAVELCNGCDDVDSVAFMAMGMGVCNWPLAEAAAVAAQELAKSRYQRTYLCLIEPKLVAGYQRAFDRQCEDFNLSGECG